MKNIFKKNQIIITALAIMIAIAGYLSFTNNDKPDDKDQIQTMDPNLKDYDVQLDDGTDVTASDETGTTVDAENEDATASDAEAKADDSKDVADASKSDKDDSKDVADISDQDVLQTAQNVADNGEIQENSEGVPGEAVLASTTLDAGFFSTQKLEREQTRAANKATLMEIINSTTLSEADKKKAVDSMIELTEIADKENDTERLLAAKGFDGAIVSIDNGKVDVIINAENITDQQLAIIEDVVKRTTNVTAKDINITPVVVSE